MNLQMNARNQRSQRGSVLPITIVFTLVVAIIGVGMSHLLLIIGGGNELQGAVNAGALRVGQHVLTVTDDTDSMSRNQFQELGWTGKDGQPRFTVGNVNRVIAKAMLIKANALDMEKNDGPGLWTANAANAENAAVKIVQSIKAKVSKRENLEEQFCTYANSNSLRMLDAKAKIVPDREQSQWQTAYLDSGAGSNIYINRNVLPPSQQSKVGTVEKDGKSYLKGYENSPLSSLRLIPFRHAERPALVSKKEFSEHTREIDKNDIPNAFACTGTANSNSGRQSATAMVETNPQQEFEMRAQDGWIRIILHPNDLDHYVLGLFERRDNYGYGPDFFKRGGFYLPLAAWATTYSAVGNEYSKNKLWGCLFPIGQSPDGEVERALVQRLREMKPGASYAELTDPIKACDVDTKEVVKDQVFYVYLNKDNKIAVSRAGAAEIPPTVRQAEQPDGKFHKFDHDFRPLPNFPNFSYATVNSFFRTARAWSFCTLHGWSSWKPSSGYNGCLGEIEQKDTTKVWVFGGGA